MTRSVAAAALLVALVGLTAADCRHPEQTGPTVNVAVACQEGGNNQQDAGTTVSVRTDCRDESPTVTTTTTTTSSGSP